MRVCIIILKVGNIIMMFGEYGNDCMDILNIFTIIKRTVSITIRLIITKNYKMKKCLVCSVYLANSTFP